MLHNQKIIASVQPAASRPSGLCYATVLSVLGLSRESAVASLKQQGVRTTEEALDKWCRWALLRVKACLQCKSACIDSLPGGLQALCKCSRRHECLPLLTFVPCRDHVELHHWPGGLNTCTTALDAIECMQVGLLAYDGVALGPLAIDGGVQSCWPCAGVACRGMLICI